MYFLFSDPNRRDWSLNDSQMKKSRCFSSELQGRPRPKEKLFISRNHSKNSWKRIFFSRNRRSLFMVSRMIIWVLSILCSFSPPRDNWIKNIDMWKGAWSRKNNVTFCGPADSQLLITNTTGWMQSKRFEERNSLDQGSVANLSLKVLLLLIRKFFSCSSSSSLRSLDFLLEATEKQIGTFSLGCFRRKEKRWNNKRNWRRRRCQEPDRPWDRLGSRVRTNAFRYSICEWNKVSFRGPFFPLYVVLVLFFFPSQYHAP